MAKQHPHSLEQISIADWEATPASVKELVSSLLVQELDNASTSEAIDRGNDRLTRFLDAASVGIAVHNAKGDLVYVNQSGKELLTQSPSPKAEKVEELPQAFRIYRSTTQQPYPLEELPSCLALAGKKVHVEDMEVHRPDRIVPLEVMANPIFNPLGEVEYVVATFLDITHHRSSEQALVESKTRYQQVVEAQTDFVLRSFPDTTITFANPALCCALGLSPQEIIGHQWIDFTPLEDLEITLKKIAGLNPDNPSFLAENRDRRVNGAIGWTQWLNQGIFNLQGELVGIQSVGRDITTLKQAELEISQQKELLQLIFDHLPLMVGLYSPTGEILMINRQLEQTKGWTKEEYQAIDVLRECYPDPAEYEATIQHIKAADSTWRDSKTKVRDGRIIDTSWIEIRLANGGSISIGQDITEQKRLVASLAEINQELETRVAQRTEALQQQEELLREAQQVAHLGSWELFVVTGEVVWSPELFQIFGYDPDQPIPSFEQQSRIFVLEDYQRLTYLIDRAIQFGEPYEVDLQIIRKDGSLGYVFGKGQPQIDEEGQVSRLVGIAMDISDRKAAEAALAESEAQNRAILRAIPDIMFRVNRAGIYLSYSKSKDLLLSLDKEQIIGQSMRDYFTPEQYQYRVHYMTVALETGETQIYEQEVTIAGILQQEEVRIVPIEDREEVLFMIRDISDRKRAEQEIIYSRDLREAIFNESTDALFLVNPETGLILDCNHRAAELFEVADKTGLIGTFGHNFQRERFTNEELAAIRLEIKKPMTWSRELEYVTQQGNFFWGSIAVKNIVVAGKNTTFTRITDISDRKRAEQEIIHSRDLREAIFNESADALFLVDSETFLTVDCNRRAVELFEATDKSQLIGIYGHDLQRQQFTMEEVETINQSTSKGLWSQELEYVTLQGNIFWGNIAVKGVPVAGKSMNLVRVTDISDRKRAEQEIIQNRDLREAIFNELADALFLVDSETLLTIDCNQEAVELFEVAEKAELIGIEGHILQRYQFTFDELVEIDQQIETNGFWSREIEYITQLGNCFWGNIAAKPIVVAGRTMNLVRVTDISDRKQAEAHTQQVAQQLETANKELEAFAYSVSHDLRTPLRAIDGFSKALMEDYGDLFDEEAQDYFDRIHRAVERMGDLIDDLLRLSRVSRAEVQHSKVNLTKLVQEIAINLQESEPSRQVEFAIIPEAIVYADTNLMRIVLENLLQNAWKFTSHHPTAHIEFGILEEDNGNNSGENPKETQGEKRYFIRDDGAGFDMAYATMLFGVFQRLHDTHEFPGTGIGLATVQRIIHRHGGRVWAEGVVEAGATIYFTLPNQSKRIDT